MNTHVEQALRRVRLEEEKLDGKLAAYESFIARVDGISARPATARVRATAGGALAVSSAPESDGRVAVRNAFSETVYPFTDTSDSVLESMADELTTDIAAAFTPGTAGFTPKLKRAILSTARERRTQCGLLADALDEERDSLERVRDDLADIDDWLAATAETRHFRLGFEELRKRHETLMRFRRTCERLARDRQDSRADTHRNGLTGVRGSQVTEFLYADLSVDHPILVDVARISETLARRQRTVRKHLATRV